ncbi:hypothetical protein ACPCSG_32515, partial [Streptomyces cellulosae]
CSVTPLGEDTYKLGNCAGIHFRNTFSGMVTKENVMQILECSDVYAKKMIDWCSGNQAALIKLINDKLEEKGNRQAITEVS